jgi:hypothetical protein
MPPDEYGAEEREQRDLGIEHGERDEARRQERHAGERHRPVADANREARADDRRQHPAEKQRRQHLAGLRRGTAEHALHEQRDEGDGAEHRHAGHEHHDERIRHDAVTK